MSALNPDESIPVALAETGRVSGYNEHTADELDHLILSCGAAGYSYAQTAACIGISNKTLKSWAVQHPRLRSILERSNTLAQAWWEGRAMDGTANAKIGSTIWNKSMSARFPQDYTERQEVGKFGEAAEVTEIKWNVVTAPKREGPGT